MLAHVTCGIDRLHTPEEGVLRWSRVGHKRAGMTCHRETSGRDRDCCSSGRRGIGDTSGHHRMRAEAEFESPCHRVDRDVGWSV